MRIAITGASGLVGGNLADVAIAAGHDVVCTKRAGSRVEHLAHLPIRWADADLASEDDLARAFAGAEIVIHCAAIVVTGKDADDVMRATNVAGTRHVIDACRRAKVRRLVHVSTVAAIGVSDGTRDATEDDAFNLAEHHMLDGYAETKRAAQDLVEAAVRAGEIDAVIACPTLMWGPYDVKPSTGRLAVELAKGRIPGGTPGTNNVVDVRDVARGLLLCAEKGRTGERYILGGENVTYHELFTRIARIGGYRAPRFVVPRALATAFGWLGDVAHRVGVPTAIDSMSVRWAYCPGFRFSHAKAARELGYAPGPADEGIRAGIEWMRARGMS
ncbi:NAD-dependent epimerase/dehydratase family protein [Sandaracinus amylolyticus]|uniref:NAD-dependent epimerase/dehydratase family protein n=1 Tax=Sandaracinus amylolyticus TaxID=927083 RepID=UPI00069FBDA4|nr:NAD-dependent epimerase/dehydratase family protein [Sandaracinus amylolyticus]